MIEVSPRFLSAQIDQFSTKLHDLRQGYGYPDEDQAVTLYETERVLRVCFTNIYNLEVRCTKNLHSPLCAGDRPECQPLVRLLGPVIPMDWAFKRNASRLLTGHSWRFAEV